MRQRTIVVSCVLALIGRLAFAQPADSELPKQAKAAYQSGDHAAASRLFEAAYREHPRPDLLYAAGMASYEANDCGRTIALLRQYLELSPPKGTEIAGERIAECERRAANARSEQRAERLGRLRGALEARDCERAREAMEAWLETEPDEAQVEALRRELADCTPPAALTRSAALCEYSCSTRLSTAAASSQRCIRLSTCVACTMAFRDQGACRTSAGT